MHIVEDVLEFPQELLDINPLCEWSRKRLFSLWSANAYVTCESKSQWIVFIRVDTCVNHNHALLLCDRHKNSFIHNNIWAVECTRKDNSGFTKRFTILSVEKI